MDPRIASLKSTTFCGRRLTRRQIADVQETVALSRNELAKTVCEHLNWTANWTVIGMTAGRRSGRRAKPPKQILVLPLEPGFRAVLKGDNRTPQRRKPPAPARDDPYVAMWMKIIDAAGELAAAHDRQWMQRKRILDSLIVVLFVFRLVLSRGDKGYTDRA